MNGRIKRKRVKQYMLRILPTSLYGDKRREAFAGMLAREWSKAERQRLRAKRRRKTHDKNIL